MSLPQVGSSPPPLRQLVDDFGRDILEDPVGNMMISADEWGAKIESGSVVQPYMDTILKNDPGKYVQFIHKLYLGGMLSFTDRPQDLITPFFVAKKSGKLRLVLDCRGVNQRFKQPPSMMMAAGASWSQVEVPDNETLYVAQSDITDYFYSLRLPDELQSYFCLPAIPHEALDVWRVPDSDRPPLHREGLVFPCFKVVPMGWSWAMYWAQRVHQLQALIGAGLSQERLLVSGKPAPSLEGGTPLVIAYADNLNVAGTCPERVQAAKDGAVAHLRSLGFGVHEELDACSSAASLGFMVDGVRGLVKPVPEKVGRVIAAFTWLSRRPRVNGRSVEKLLGHAVHFMLLRRELLSCMRSLYDYVQATYRARRRLWKSAAREAGWVASLLKICHADLRRRWDDQVTSSDASLSGMAVSCRLADREQVARLSRQQEQWRFKTRDFSAPRERALGQDASFPPHDPFSDPDTVKPKAVLPEDPFTINADFDEIPASFMECDDWHDLFAVRFHHPEPITVLESRGVVAAIQHKCRSARNFNKRHLHLNDNLANVLCCEKGRSASFHMLSACRKLCALLVAANCSVHHRWIPSELNPSDHASRRWEPERKRLQAVAQEDVAKQSGAEVRQHGNALPESCVIGDKHLFDGKTSFSTSVPARGFKAGARNEEKKTDGGEPTSTVSRANFPGTGGHLRAGGDGLCQQSGAIYTGRGDSRHSGADHAEIGRVLEHISKQHVLGRRRHFRRKQDLRSRSGRQARLFPSGTAAEVAKMLKRLGEPGSRSDSSTNAFSADSFDRGDHDPSRHDSSRTFSPDHVQCLSPARRSAVTVCKRRGLSHKDCPVFCNQPAPSGQNGIQQDRIVGRVCPDRLDCAAPARPYVGSPGTSAPRSYTVRHRLCHAAHGVAPGSPSHRAGKELRSALPIEALRPKSRSSSPVEDGVRNQDAGTLGQRLKCQEIRSPQPAFSGISAAAGQHSTRIVGGGETPAVPHGQVFLSSLGPLAPWVVEIFAGSARLSHACSKAGYNALAVDVAFGADCDILKIAVQQRLFHFLKTHRVALVWLGMPCTTWSRARKFDNLGPPPVRDDGDGLWGLPHLSRRDAEKVKQSNLLLQVSCHFIKYCQAHNISWALENPSSSRVWLTAPLRELQRLGHVAEVHYCQYRQPWKKPTRMLSGPSPWLLGVHRTCNTQSGRCSATGRRHIRLVGTDASGNFMTLRAQPYPAALCSAIAAALQSAVPVTG